MVPTDLERAVTVLALVHKLIPAPDAVALISNSRRAASRDATLLTGLQELIPNTDLLSAVAQELRFGFIDLHAPDTQWRADSEAATKLGANILQKSLILPVRDSTGNVALVAANPRTQAETITWLRNQLQKNVPVFIAPKQQIESQLVYLSSEAFDHVAPPEVTTDTATETTAAPLTATENPVVDYVDNLLHRAVAENASDVHFLSQADGSLLIRFRVDGRMRRQAMPLRGREREVIGTILAKCGDNLDASDRTRPQDGTFSFISATGRGIDARLGMLPQAHGPTVVIRLLDPQNINRRLEDMGFSTYTLEQMRRVVRYPQGSVFFIGPTGSGKTTTLYSLLKELPAQEMSILTAEDPIEYRLPNIGQTQIRTDLGEKSLTFAKALRSMLRLDPDVILVGEVRDPETAETSMHAALTGHMVLSTLHAKTAVATYQRLEELNVDPYLSAESVSLAVNQRLVRLVHSCAEMGTPSKTEVEVLKRLKLEIPDEVVKPREGGCNGCNHTGFAGRSAVVEIMEPTSDLKELVATRAPRSEIIAAATATGYTPILDDAFRHVLSGRMSVMELLRVEGAGEG